MKRLHWILAGCVILGLGVVCIGRGGKGCKEKVEKVEMVEKAEEVEDSASLPENEEGKGQEELGEISGRITERSTGKGVPHMRLQLTLRKGEEKVFGKSISTDKDGYFAFKSLPPADRYIVVPYQLLPRLTPKEKSGSLLAEKVIKDVDFTIDRKVSFAPAEEAENQAAFGTISGRVVADDTGEGIEWIEVNVKLKEKEVEHPFYTLTNAEGYYELRGLPPGIYGVHFSPGMQSEFISTDNAKVYNTRPPLPIYTTDLPEGGNITFPDFTLVRGGGVSGIVVDKDGKPIKQALISTNCGFSGITDEKGEFTILGLPEWNTCKLVIQISGYAELPLAEGFKIKKGEINNLGMLQPSWDLSTGIEGVVRSSITNKPIKGAYVRIYQKKRHSGSARTNRDGYYKIVGFPEGVYDFQSYLPISDPEDKYSVEENIAFEKGTIVKRDISFDIESFEPAVDPVARDKLNSCGAGRMSDIRKALDKASQMWTPPPSGCLPQSEIDRFDPNEKPYIYFYCSTEVGGCGSPVFNELTVNLSTRKYKGSEAGAWNVGNCGCLEGTIFHELMHFTDPGRETGKVTTQDERDAYNCTKKCINCSRSIPCEYRGKWNVCKYQLCTAWEQDIWGCHQVPKCEAKPCKTLKGCNPKTGQCIYEDIICDPPTSYISVYNCIVYETITYYYCGSSCVPYYYTISYPSPGCDQPDENENDSSPLSGTIPNYDRTSPIGVLLGPNLTHMFDLLDSFKEKATIVTPEEISPSLLDRVRLLIIPSGGLMGLSNSELFKQALAEYVALGGSVISMTQQVGEEFSILPGETSGDGWTEDTSCIYMSGYVYNNHQILAGQFTDKPWLHVDGRIYSFPPNATEILRRRSGSGDILISYPYGNGNVIASTLYSDYSFFLGALTSAEMVLIRDMVSWARRPMLLPEAMLGETVNYELQITNGEENTQLATTVVVEILDPNRSATQSTQTFPISLSPGESTSISISYQTEETSALGIWHTRYTLLNEEGELIQPTLEEDTGRFAIVSPTIPDIPELEFFVDSDADEYLRGTDATFTISIKNNTDIDRMISVMYQLNNIRYDFGLFLIPGQQTVEVPISVKVSHTGAFFASFFELDGNIIVSVFKLYTVYPPSVSVKINPDKQEYGRGETVNLILELRNQINFGYDTTVDLIVSDPDNVAVYSTSLSLTLAPIQAITEIFSFPLAFDAAGGNYNIKAEIYDSSGEKIDIALANFELPMFLLSVAPILPPVFSEQNYVEFEIINIGGQDVTLADFYTSLTDPAQNIIWSGSQELTNIPAGESTLISFQVPVSQVLLGDYQLDYTLTYHEKVITGKEIIQSRGTLGIILDKASYKLNESVGMTISLENLGCYVDTFTVVSRIPALNFSHTQEVLLDPGQKHVTNLTVLIPPDFSGNSLKADVVATLPSGDSLSKEIASNVLPLNPALSVNLDKESYRIREDINLVITASEPGNFVGSLTPALTTTIPDLNFDDTKLLTLVPGVSTSVSYSLTIPETVNPGNYGGTATITFPNGVEKTVDFAILIPQSKIKIHPLAQTDYSIGDTVSLTVENVGGVDTTFDYQIRLLSEGGEVVLLDETGNGSVNADETVTLSFNIPEQTGAGSSILNVQTTDHKTDKIGDYFKYLNINGLFATLEVNTKKEIYLKTENINGLAELANGGFDLSGGNLNLKAANLKKAGEWTIPPMWILNIYSVAVDKFRKEIWIGEHVGGGLGIGRFDGNNWWPYMIDCEISAEIASVLGIAVDDLTGEVWFVTDGCGVYSFDGNDWNNYNTINSDLTSDNVWSVAIDEWGDKWFGTWGGGVSRFDGINWTPYNTANSGLASDYVLSIAIDETTGEIWFATGDEASRFDGTNWTTYDVSNCGLLGENWAIAIDSQNNKWFTLDGGICRFDGVNWIAYTSEDGLVDDWPYSLATDPATGEVWVGHYNCGVSRFDGSDWSSMSVPLIYCNPGAFVASIAVDWEGAVWFGVVGAGVARYKEEVIEEILWEDNLSIDLVAEEETTLPAPIGTLGVTGKLYFLGTLTSELGQQIAQDKYPFYVIDEEIALTYAPDRQLYKQGDTVAISGEVWNFAGIGADGLNLELSAGYQVIYNELFDIPAEESHPFSLTIPAATEGMVNLLGVVTQDESLLVTVRERYEVAWPVVTAAVEAPEVVGEEAFEISVELENSGEVEADLVVSVDSTIGSQTQELTLEAGEKVSLTFIEQVTQDTTFNIEISGDYQETITRDVLYGLAVIIDVEAEGFYPIGQIAMPFTVTNIGLLAHDYEVIFELFDANNNLLATVTRSYYLQPFSSPFGNSAEDFLWFELGEGDYRLSFSTLGFSGEVNFSVLIPQATVALTSAPVYPEGVVSIPYLISNIGVVPGEFVVGFDLEAQGTTIESQELGVYLNPIGTPPEDLIGSEYEGELQYNLSEGEYLLTASGERLVSPAQISFQVVRAEDVAMEAEFGAKANGQQEVYITLNNLGYYDFNGSLQLDTGFWSEERSISVVESTIEAFSITLTAASPGAQILNIYLYNSSGNLFAELEKFFEVNPPIFQVTQLPAYMTFPAGEMGDLSFSVSNLGDLTGQAELDFIVFDYEPDPGFAFIDPGQTGNFTFTFFIPEDLEERDYYGSYELKSVSEGKTYLIEEGLVKFYVEGVKVEVTATLDKEFYRLNDIAKLTLNITPAGALAEVSLNARVSYSNFEEVIPFTLSISGNTLSFDVPIDTFYPNKLLYEILFPGGRTIYINTLYIQQQHDNIWLYTDKDLYLPGDVVIATVEASTNGVASIFTSELIGFTSTVSLSAYTPTEVSFTLPQDILGGTYVINYGLQAPESPLHTYKFDVHGLMAFFKQIALDKSRYEPEDTIHASFILEANMDFTGYLDCFVIDPEGEMFANSTYAGDFNEGLNYFATTGGFSTVSAGMFKYYCILYADESREKVLTTVMEYFDVGSITLASIWSDKYIYESCVDGAIVTIDLFGEEITGVLELYLDDNLVYQEDVPLNGFSTLEVPLDQDQIKLLGVRELRASLFSNSLVSTKVTSFFTRDTIPPEISVTQVADGEVYSTDVTPVIVVTDCNLSNQVITLNGESFTSGTTVTTDAEYFLSIIAGDLAGNYSTTIVSFIIDKTAPVIATGISDGDCINSSTVVVGGTVFDAASGVASVVVNEVTASIVGGTFAATLTGLPEGLLNITVSALDNAGNSSSFSIDVDIDTLPPNISITSPVDGLSVIIGDVTVSGTADNEVTSVMVISDQGHNESSTVDVDGNWSVVLSAVNVPSIVITAQVADVCGNIGSDSVTVPVFMPPIWYVDASAPAGGDGTSWETAFTVIQDAVEAASSGDWILVAEGTYTSDSEAPVLTMKGGVEIYGGFTGTEVDFFQRSDPDAHPTILDGENTSYHVIVGVANARLDGFIVMGGNANGPGSGNSGGGMYNDSVANLMVVNCIFSDNRATSYGGGMYNDESTLTIISTIFKGNSITRAFVGYGGGIYNRESSPTIINSIFIGNSAVALSGGCRGGFACGGGMYNESNSSPTIINCVFSGNSTNRRGGGLCNYDNSSPTIKNCIMWGDIPGEIYNSSSSPTVTYSDIEADNVYPGEGNINEDPLFVGYPNLHLQARSPCKDTGTESGAPSYDLDGNPRPSGEGYDMGAYEFQSVVAKWYVDVNAPPGGDGTSWEAAFTVVQDAADAASSGDMIWVARGTYTKSIGGNESVLTMKDGIIIYGGFNGDEIDLSERGIPTAYPTILDGENTSHHVVIGASDARLDGFIVMGGNANGDGSGNSGGGMYNDSVANLIVTNCTFSDNSANRDGGGMYNFESSPIINNCNFINNSAGSSGGGMFNVDSSPTIINCTFSDNTAASDAGGVYNSASSPMSGSSSTIINCIFIGNSAIAGVGGGMGNDGMTDLVVDNCTFSDNSATEGGGMFNSGSSPTITNCIMWGDIPGEISNSSSTPTVTYSDIEGDDVYPGEGNINDDPLFVAGPNGDYYLSQTAAGQPYDSPCVDTGSDTAANLRLDDKTTRTDAVTDMGTLDMGYHYNPLDITPPAGLAASPPGGVYCSMSVTLSCDDPGATIYYTTDNTEPTAESTEYVLPIDVNEDTTLKFMAVDICGNQSSTVTEVYDIDTEAPTGLAAAPAGGSYCATTVSLTASDGTISFTIDGSEPTTGSSIYAGPIDINEDTTLKFMAVDICGNQSSTVTEVYDIDLEAPTGLAASPAGGSYCATTVSLIASDGTIYFTIDGSDPTTGSSIYTGPIDIIEDTTLKFMAVDTCGNQSSTVTEVYDIDLEAPTGLAVTPAGDVYCEATTVSLIASDGTIYFTIDGSDPTTGSSIYTGPIDINEDTTLKFMAVDICGNQSSIETEFYYIDTEVPTGLAAAPAGGSYCATMVSLTASDGTIYFTIDGSDPTTGSSIYTGPIDIIEDTTLKFMAVDTCGNQSSTVTEVYDIDLEAPTGLAASPAGGSYCATTVSLIASDGTIYFTIDGNEPTTGSSIYAGPIDINEDTTLKFMAVDICGNQSSTVTEVYDIDLEAPTGLTVTPAGDVYCEATTVSLIASDGTIYYTIDGSDPTTGSLIYTGPIDINEDTTLKFMAVDICGNQSYTVTEVYYIDKTPPLILLNSPLPGSCFSTSQLVVNGTISDLSAVSSVEISIVSIFSGGSGVYELGEDTFDEGTNADLGDVDGDGDLDVIVVNHEQNRLYLNDGNGTFTDVTATNLPVDEDNSEDVDFGDVDGDGDLDVIVANTAVLDGQNRLYLNDGNGIFTDVTATNLPVDDDDSRDAELGDIDGDGDLDIIVANRREQNRLYLNDGNGAFTDVTNTNLPDDDNDSRGIEFGDVDGDGDLDVIMANTALWGGGQNRLYLNDGNGTFTDVTATNLPDVRENSRDTEFGDVDGDGDLDIIVANYGQSRLYQNDGNGIFTDVTATNLPVDGDNSEGVEFGDVDGDGDLDVIVTNDGQNRLYLNDGNGAFTDVTNTNLPVVGDNSSDADFGDVDGDGDLDVIVVNDGYQSYFLINGNEIVARTSPVDPFSEEFTEIFNSLTDGIYSLEVTATDACGNQSSIITEFVIDTEAPTDLAASPAEGSYCATTVSLIASDGSIYFTIDGSEPTIESPVYMEPIDISENITLKFMAVDDCGNRSSAVTEVYDIDTEAPTGLTATPAGGSYCATTVSLSVSDGTIYCTIDGSEPTTDSWVYTGPADITMDIIAKCMAVDACGNQSDTITEVYDIDTEAVITITSPVSGADDIYSGDLMVSGTADDDVTSVTIISDQGHSESSIVDLDGNWSVVLTEVIIPSIIITVQGTDGCDNFGSDSVTVPVMRRIWYVDDNPPTNENTGGSWDEAFTIIQDAAEAALYGDWIWVAEGTYTSDIPTSSVLTMKSGVEIYGGFTGTESYLSERYPATSETILDGNNTSYHVVVGASNARLDGFIVMRGNANGGGSDDIGGGMHNDSVTNLIVDNCAFNGNSANQRGGGMYNFESSPTITNCIFSTNSASRGGGIHNNDSSSPLITNCIFSGNSASQLGGGMYNFESSPEITNCTFNGNSADEYGGGISNRNDSSPTVTNCILWGNMAPTGSELYNDGGSVPIVTYSDIEGYFVYPGEGNINDDPLFVTGPGGAYYLSQPPNQVSTSPCVDAGSDTAVNLGMDDKTTRTDGLTDTDMVDIGYHYTSSNWAFFVTGSQQGNVYVFRSRRDGTFVRQIVGNVGANCLGSAVADFDNDGDLDFVIQDSAGRSNLFVNKSDVTLKFTHKIVAEGLVIGGYFGYEAATADFNNDGYYDYILPGAGYFYLFLNTGQLTFSQSTVNAEWIGTKGRLAGIDAGDFNEDGNMDFLVVIYESGCVFQYTGNGDGTFTYDLAFCNSNHGKHDTQAAVVGDFNSDGHLDAIVGQNDDGDPGQTWLYVGDGAGNFSYWGEAYDTNPIKEAISYEERGAGYADAYDFDEDGILDIVASANAMGMLFFKGIGDGTFQPSVTISGFISLGISTPPLP